MLIVEFLTLPIYIYILYYYILFFSLQNEVKVNIVVKVIDNQIVKIFIST